MHCLIFEVVFHSLYIEQKLLIMQAIWGIW